jgi:hypothetical protein
LKFTQKKGNSICNEQNFNGKYSNVVDLISNALLIWTPAKFNAEMLIEIILEGNPATETD